MLDQKEIIDFLREQYPVLEKNYNISKIGIFGSFARNEEDDKSDIDIILEFEPGTRNIYEKKTDLKSFLQSRFHRNVDLCREKYIKPYIKNYIQKEAIYV
ncbi:MAG: nucleotidyltransferase family protein [candidate division KSB1 bacterium]|nr:nucleotidyltransferase family protein [candidate division KSB1 bacterium]